MTDTVKSVLHDATPSWNGYNYQGKVGLYVCLANILKEAKKNMGSSDFNVFLDEYYIEYEWIEDFAIKKNDIYVSLHQVKHKAENNFNNHVEAIATILFRKKSVLSDSDLFKYFKVESKKKGDADRFKAEIKKEITEHKLLDDIGRLSSDWKDKVQSVAKGYRDNIFKCFSDFESLTKKAFISSTTYFHTAEEVNPPSIDIDKFDGIPSQLGLDLTHPKSLSCQQIFLSFDKQPTYELALSDEELNSKIEGQIEELLKLLHKDTTFDNALVKLYKTALSALIDQNIVARHQHVRDKLDKDIPYLQRTKPSISFRAIVNELEKIFIEQNEHYWNLSCRENFEAAYNEQLDELYQDIKSSNCECEVQKYRQFVIRLESVRINIIEQYFPDDSIGFLRQIYPHKTPMSNLRQFYESISEPQKIKSVFLDFIQEIIKPSGKLTLNSPNMRFQYQPSCISFNENNERRKNTEINKAKKGLADNQSAHSGISKSVDYIVVNSTDADDVIPAGIQKITDVGDYDPPASRPTDSDKYTSDKEVCFMDSRKALGEING